LLLTPASFGDHGELEAVKLLCDLYVDSLMSEAFSTGRIWKAGEGRDIQSLDTAWQGAVTPEGRGAQSLDTVWGFVVP
jgi:hypothetical protein